jgi:hypothetical protein
MLAPAVQRNLQQVLILPQKPRVTELFRETRFYFTFVVVFLSLLMAAVVEYGRAIYELPRV